MGLNLRVYDGLRGVFHRSMHVGLRLSLGDVEWVLIKVYRVSGCVRSLSKKS